MSKVRFSPDIHTPVLRDKLYLCENVPDAAYNCTFCAITDGNIVLVMDEIGAGKEGIRIYLYHDLLMGQADEPHRSPRIFWGKSESMHELYDSFVGGTAYDVLSTIKHGVYHVACVRCAMPIASLKKCLDCQYCVDQGRNQ